MLSSYPIKWIDRYVTVAQFPARGTRYTVSTIRHVIRSPRVCENRSKSENLRRYHRRTPCKLIYSSRDEVTAQTMYVRKAYQSCEGPSHSLTLYLTLKPPNAYKINLKSITKRLVSISRNIFQKKKTILVDVHMYASR